MDHDSKVAITRTDPRPKSALVIRRPTQSRGIKKFEAILEATEILLRDRGPEDISIYDIAREINSSPPSVYHFFPDVSLVFSALTEKYINSLKDYSFIIRDNVFYWTDITDDMFRQVLNEYNNNAAMRRLMLGGDFSPQLRRMDISAYSTYAAKIIENISRYFVINPDSNLSLRVEEMMSISDAMWSIDFFRHGVVTETGEMLASQARNTYLCLYLPKYLPKISSDANPE